MKYRRRPLPRNKVPQRRAPWLIRTGAGESYQYWSNGPKPATWWYVNFATGETVLVRRGWDCYLIRKWGHDGEYWEAAS